MAVVSVESLPEGWEGTHNSLWQRTYKRQFRVETDSRTDGPVTIRLATDGGSPPAPLVPRVGGSYFVTSTEKDLGAFVTNVTTAFEDFNELGGLAWIVTLDYGPYDASSFGPDPTAWPMLVSFGSARYERVVTVDQAGAPILNSAGDPFDEPVTVDDSRSVITVERNELVKYVAGTGGGGSVGFDPTLAERYRDKVNASPWNGFAAKTVKCSGITTGNQQYDSNAQVWYYTVSYVFEINRDTWVKHLLDQGFNVLVSGKPTPVMSKGQRVEEPVLLDGSGNQLTTGSPVFRSFDAYPSDDFSVFNIDLSAALGRA